MTREASVNSDARSVMDVLRDRVARTQAKYHCWAKADPQARFGDLFNLVCDPGRLLVAWEHVARNKGSRTAGIDGLTARRLETAGGIGVFLKELSEQLGAGVYRPSPVRRVTIPKPGGKTRPLGIPTIADRVVQQSLKMVLEPIFEADFLPVSYGFRPMRRAQDAVAEIHHYATSGYLWVFGHSVGSDDTRGVRCWG
jgi:RNA-directed DNA polymerase